MQHNGMDETTPDMETLLKEFFEKEAQHGFVKRLKKFLHQDFTHLTIKDFMAFMARKHGERKPSFDPLEAVPAIIREVGAVQVECIKLYTKFLYEEARSQKALLTIKKAI